MNKKDTKNKENKKVDNELSQKEKYEDYLKWYSLPINEKMDDYGCKNETQFRAKYDVSTTTLWRWKNKDDFQESIKKTRFEWSKRHAPNVFAGLLNSCLKGNPYSIELWLNYFEKWDKKHIIQNQVQEFTNDDLLKLIEVLPKDKQQKFYDTVNTIIIAGREERDRRANEAASREAETGEDGQTDKKATNENQAQPAIKLGNGHMDTANGNEPKGNESGKTDNLPPVEKSGNEVAESSAKRIRHNMERKDK